MTAEVICITGNTATGTTTLASKLGALNKWDVAFSEDYLRASPYFDRFLSDPMRWAFHNQTFFLAEYISAYFELTKSIDNSLCLDYSIYELAIYTEAMQTQGYLDNDETETINKLIKLYKPHLIMPTKIVFLTSPTNDIIDRLSIRGRQNDNKINSSFIETLQQTFGSFFSKFTECPLLKIDSTKMNFLDDNIFQQVAEQISNFG